MSKSALQSLKDALQLRTPQARNLALDLGLLKGHSDYIRFIILGRSRTGSNFLRGLLNSHPNAVVFGELFQNRSAISWGFEDYAQTPRLFQTFLDQPVEFVEKQVFRRMPQHIEAVGFKIFYYHAQTEPWKPLWDYLLNDRDLHVIHIKRRNMLRTHLSRARADRSGSWTNTTGRREEEAPIVLNYEECLKDFTRTAAYEREYDELFAAHPLLEVIYEDLAASYASEARRIQKFLCLDEKWVAPQTFKQSHEPLSQAIANFAELKDQFTGSPFESFFAEGE